VRTRTRHIRQVEEADCGAACLAVVLAWHGRHVEWTELQRICGGGRDGLSAATLVRAATHFGLDCKGKRVRLTGDVEADRAALATLATPAVLFTGRSHFVVLERVDARSGVRLNDPASGRRRVGPAEFRTLFSGIALVFSPGAHFVRGGRPESVRSEVLAWLRRRPGLLADTQQCAPSCSPVPIAAGAEAISIRCSSPWRPRRSRCW
jgi:ABC-type bacteriocin/lantibiotic exporter with double-glycine peptidase domain